MFATITRTARNLIVGDVIFGYSRRTYEVRAARRLDDYTLAISVKPLDTRGPDQIYFVADTREVTLVVSPRVAAAEAARDEIEAEAAMEAQAVNAEDDLPFLGADDEDGEHAFVLMLERRAEIGNRFED